MRPVRLKLISSDEAKPFRVQHKAPCSDCPWRRDALKGWLGPRTVAQWIALARDYWHVIECHTRRMMHREDRPRLAEETDGHWECAGAAIYRANTCVRPFPGRNLLQLPANRITVFASPTEFEAHHGLMDPDERAILDLREEGRKRLQGGRK